MEGKKMDDLSLKQCPFCGERDFLWDGETISCNACGAIGPESGYVTDGRKEGRARSKWNWRTIDNKNG